MSEAPDGWEWWRLTAHFVGGGHADLLVRSVDGKAPADDATRLLGTRSGSGLLDLVALAGYEVVNGLVMEKVLWARPRDVLRVEAVLAPHNVVRLPPEEVTALLTDAGERRTRARQGASAVS